MVILACAGLCDYDRELTAASGVPVIDPVVAGVKMAEAFVGMGISHSKVRKFHAPPQPVRRLRRGERSNGLGRPRAAVTPAQSSSGVDPQ